ncbi:hypothetical protein [Mucilaginibacter sp. SG538B]|uniref:hypothetical protein n=1 Tax=Mucilaginibacter sp. SG538B TaxID=2587021 RepID=UPI00159E2AE5|nr:hypothetical protein [Mucilaginibacter sp. SG538B]
MKRRFQDLLDQGEAVVPVGKNGHSTAGPAGHFFCRGVTISLNSSAGKACSFVTASANFE